MDGVRPKDFAGQPADENKDIEQKGLPVSAGRGASPKKRKTRHKKFIDLQKDPPKLKPIIEE